MARNDAALRTWWRQLSALPDAIGAVHRWRLRRREPAGEGAEIHAMPTSVVCLGGELRVRRGRDAVVLAAGDALLIDAAVPHVHEPATRGATYFRQGFLPDRSDVNLGDAAGWWVGILPTQPCLRMMRAALACGDARRRRELAADLIRQVLAERVRDGEYSHPALRRMVRLMWDSNHVGGLTVADLVRASGVSRTHAHRIFRAGYGITAKAALASARLGMAASLLASDVAIAEIARRCGFRSHSTFSRAWRRAHGSTPRGARTASRGSR